MDICMRCPLAPIRVTLTSSASFILHAIACGMMGPLVVFIVYFASAVVLFVNDPRSPVPVANLGTVADLTL